MNVDGKWETPWETMCRESIEEVEYWSDNDHAWCPFNLNDHESEYKFLKYLEGRFGWNKQGVYNRIIGLFIIRLNERIQFRPKDPNEIVCVKYSVKNRSIHSL